MINDSQLSTKQYKFGASASWEGNRRSVASHWPCVTDIVYHHLRAHGLRKVHPAYTPLGVWHTLPFIHL